MKTKNTIIKILLISLGLASGFICFNALYYMLHMIPGFMPFIIFIVFITFPISCFICAYKIKTSYKVLFLPLVTGIITIGVLLGIVSPMLQKVIEAHNSLVAPQYVKPK